MKKLIILFVLFIFYGATVVAQECYPNSDGKYIYYANLNMDNVDESFNKERLMSLLANSEEGTQGQLEELDAVISNVNKSFPTAVTDFLQKSITIQASSPNIDAQLAKYSDIFNLVEMLCFPKEMLLYEPNDYSSNGSHYRKSHLELVNAPEAWNITTGNVQILIGITDTYIEDTHEDLANQIAQILQNGNPNFHGVHVAGCAAADTDNGLGIAGIGFKSKIVFSSVWASDNIVLQMAQIPGVRVINCSWINNCIFNTAQEMLYDEIKNVHNTIVVAGAGNKPAHCGDNAYVYPAAYDNVISVTSVGHISDIGYVDPGYGANNWKDCHEEVIGDVSSTHHHNDKVNICAPGYNVLSTKPNNSYGGSWGTSFASPIVAGACALVAAVNPCLTAIEIMDIVLNTADPSLYFIPENADYVGLLGSGRLDAFEAVKRALDLGTVYIQNKTYNTTVTETAETAIKAGYNVTTALPYGNVILNSGADVTFEATHHIVLSAGFKVENNATFKGLIYTSNCF